MADSRALVAPVMRFARPRSNVMGRRIRAGLALLPLLVIALLAIIGPMIAPMNPEQVLSAPNLSPNTQNWFGTDSSGLDVFSRTLAATRLNVIIAVSVAVSATLIGIIVGVVLGMNEARGGVVGLICHGLSRVIDLFQAVPAIVIAIVAVSYAGISTFNLIVVMAILLAPTQARLVRTEVLRVRGEAYVDAARIGGFSEFALALRHILPNSIKPALENAPVSFGSAVILTASLGFLGVGVPPPTPEWGSMIAGGGSDAAVGRWWSSLFPSLFLIFTVMVVSYAVPRYMKSLGRQ